MVSRSCAAFVFPCSVIFGAMLLPFSSALSLAAVSLPPFYEAAAKIIPDGKLGDIVKQEKVPTPIAGAQACIAYIASDIADRKTVVTALVIAPTGKAPLEGRPIVAWAHGTTGAAQNCGPSQVPNPAQPLNEYFLLGGNSWTDYGVPAAEEFIRSGYVLVATDYQGLGGGGRHQYMVSVTQARDAIELDQRSRRLEGNRRRQTGTDLRLVAGRRHGGRRREHAGLYPANRHGVRRHPDGRLCPRWRRRMSRSRRRQENSTKIRPTSSSAACERRSRRTPSSSRTWR